jgi:hypothetical protein
MDLLLAKAERIYASGVPRVSMSWRGTTDKAEPARV